MQKGDTMELAPTAWMVILVFAAVLGIGLLGPGLTGNISGSMLPLVNGTSLSVLAATVAVGVLVIAGLQQQKV